MLIEQTVFIPQCPVNFDHHRAGPHLVRASMALSIILCSLSLAWYLDIGMSQVKDRGMGGTI